MFLFLPFFITSKIKYGIVVDAGSSGTRFNFFTWDSQDNYPNVDTLKDKNGASIYLELPKLPLSKVATDEKVLSDIFEPFIKLAVDSIPSDSLSKTRLFVYATAGLRLLSIFDQQRVINLTFNYLVQKTPFKILPNSVRVIDGEEEGIFGWLSINHLRKNFQNQKPTEGCLDFGGASMQITLEITDNLHDEPTKIVSIGNKKYSVYTHSYLGYGVYQASSTILQALLATSRNQTIYNPCYLKGYTGTKDGVNMIGTGDFSHCLDLTSFLLKHPTFSTVSKANISGTPYWIGLSSIYYVNKFFQLNENSKLSDFQLITQEFCSLPFSEISPKFKYNDYCYDYCSQGVFQWNLLKNGFGYSDDTHVIDKLSEIGGSELSWAAGALLYNIADIEIEDIPQFSWVILLLWTILFLGVLVLIYFKMFLNCNNPVNTENSSISANLI